MLLSIIIPVYNVEKYLRKCLLSCVNQNVLKSEYEIIVINDGSPDNSLLIAEEFANKYDNIRVVSQKNKGLSEARNVGMSYAYGKYIWFVDSDDWIEKDCLCRLFVELLKEEVDILQLQYRLVYDDTSLNREVSSYIIEGIQSGKNILLDGGFPAPAQFSIYRAQFLKDNGLEFVRGIYHEDSEFKPRAIYCAKSIKSDDKISYNYYQRLEGNITASFRLKNGIDLVTVMNSLYKFAIEKNVDKHCLKAFCYQIGMCMNSLLLGYRQLNSEDKEVLRQYLKRNRYLFSLMVQSGNLKYALEGL